jgi:hypothetical protein
MKLVILQVKCQTIPKDWSSVAQQTHTVRDVFVMIAEMTQKSWNQLEITKQMLTLIINGCVLLVGGKCDEK